MLWVVVPTYNERENLPQLVRGLLELPLEVLVVDDASPDGTGQLADTMAKVNPRLHVLHRAGKLGLGSAYREGFAYAMASGASLVGEMDADNSHSPGDISRLVAVIESGADIAIGSRRVPGGAVIGWGPWRHLMSWGAMTVSRLALGLKTKDVTAGFRLYTKKTLMSIPWRDVKSDGYAFQEEILFLCERANLKIVEIPVVFTDRTKGKSKLNTKNAIEFFATMWRLRKLH